MRSVVHCLDAWAATQPDKLLFVFVDAHGQDREAYTYSQFRARTRQLASQLARVAGFARGDRVLLAYPPGLDLVVAFFACARIGVIPVPVCPPTAMRVGPGLAKLGSVAADCQASAALTSQAVLEFVRSGSKHRDRESRVVAAALDLEWIASDGLRELSSPCVDDDPSPLLFLQYTSGSTGAPRGVIVTHENVLENAVSTVDHVAIGVSWLPQYHDMGLIGYYLFAAVSGATTYGLSPLDFLKRPALWLRTMGRVRATYASAPNFGFEYCLRPGKIEDGDLAGVDLSSLRVLMSAAEPVREETFRRFIDRFAPCGLRPDAHVVAYGLAENTLAVTHYGRRFVAVDAEELRLGVASIAPPGAGEAGRVNLASCGRPLPGVRVRIVDPDTRRALPDRRVGEVWIAGPSVCQGYWARPRLTEEIFHNTIAGDPDGDRSYLRTGDLGFLDGGELFVCGRIKELIIIRGVNHYPQDIEAAVESTSEKIRGGGVAAFNGDDPEETLVIVAELRNPRDAPDPAEIARAVRARCRVEPSLVVLVPPRTIARTTSGKSARRVTRQRFLAGELPAVAIYHASPPLPDASAAQSARERIRTVLAFYGGTRGASATLEALGLDSLALTEMLLDLEQVFADWGAPDVAEEIDVSLLQRLTAADLLPLFERTAGPTPAELAAWRDHLQRIRGAFERDVQSRMRADAKLGPADLGTIELGDEPVGTVLMTGATGFFGRYLLASLLGATPYRYCVLLRARDAGHGRARLHEALRRAGLLTPSLAREVERRVRVVCGDLARGRLGLSLDRWTRLARDVHAVVHTAALVNYVLTYDALKPHNVDATRTLLRFALTARGKEFHFISSTFIFGWTRKGVLVETDNNDEMENLDFGYAQTKWVAEQLVLAAESHGLKVRIYRPSLLSASSAGVGDPHDVAIRVLSFMINQGIAVDTPNQVSLVPVDVAAADIAAIIADGKGGARTLHITADRYYSMTDVTRLIAREHGYVFTYYDIPGFVQEMNRRCRKGDPLYPLLNFFNRSAGKIAAMQLKRYGNDRYREARSRHGRSDTPLPDIISYLMACMRRHGLINAPALSDGAFAARVP